MRYYYSGDEVTLEGLAEHEEVSSPPGDLWRIGTYDPDGDSVTVGGALFTATQAPPMGRYDFRLPCWSGITVSDVETVIEQAIEAIDEREREYEDAE